MGSMLGSPDSRRFSDFYLRLSWICGAAALIVACVAIRWCWGTRDVEAQAPVPHRVAPVGAALPASVAPPGAARPVSSAPQTNPNLAAVVNGEPISRAELGKECLRRFGAEVLESMVNRQLILFACKTRNITITAQDVEHEITTMASKFGLSNDRWFEMLQKERNISPQQYRNEIVWPTVALKKLAAEKIQVGQEEFKQAWESEYGPRVKVRMISVTSAKKAEELRAKAMASPEEFASLAKDFSEDENSAAARGLVPPIRKHAGDAKLEKAAFSLEEGSISPVIQVGNQHVLLKCEKQMAAADIPAQFRKEAEERVMNTVRERKMRSASTELFSKLQNEAKVENVYNDAQREAKNPGVAAIVNGRTITVAELAEECLLRNGAETLEGEINRRLLMQALKARGQKVTEADIDTEIARAAKSYGFQKRDGSPDVDTWLKRVTQEQNVSIELYVRDAVWPSVALKELVGDSVKVTDEDIKKGFESNYGERVEAMVIVLGNQRQAQQVWDMARKNSTEEFFGQLAATYSIEPISKANSGRVPPIRKHSGQPTLEKEAFALAKNELSGIVVMGDKFVVMRCLGRTKPVAVDFKDVREQLHQDLMEKQTRIAMAQQFDSLRESGRWENFLTGESHSGKTAKASFTSPSTTPNFNPRAGIPTNGTSPARTPTGIAPGGVGSAGGGVSPASATAPTGEVGPRYAQPNNVPRTLPPIAR